MLDTSVFKKMARNDTGAAVGHQGGIVIPKDIAEFFPRLTNVASESSPTVDKMLRADLFVDGNRVDRVETRYQHQTWGGTRSAERRLTGNLGALRNEADADDIVLFTKDLQDDGYIQIHLLRKGTSKHAIMETRIGEKRWGVVDPENPPLSVAELEDAEIELENTIAESALVIGEPRTEIEVKSMRKARKKAFRNKLMSLYGYRCAFSGRKFVSPISPTIVGLDAAHVVPVHANGTDHPANGIPLTKDIHWAFDKGLIGVGENRRIVVPQNVGELDGNEFLQSLDGAKILEAGNQRLRVSEEALEWHRTNVLLK